ncbi:MAG: hypothetical protein AB8G05_16320 [Oligoflexales bacterium]
MIAYTRYLPILFLAFGSCLFSQVKYSNNQMNLRNIDATVRIGIVVEQSSQGNIAPETKDYFKNLKRLISIGNKLIHVKPVPLNAFVRSRLKFNKLTRREKITSITNLVREDLKKVNAIVFPGDDYNFPPFRANQDPLTELLNYEGLKEIHDEQTIYGMSAREFYKRFPHHQLNPFPDSLIYEGILIETLAGLSLPILSSCHGTMMFGFIHGARFKAGIQGHVSHNSRMSELLLGSKAAQLLGPHDTMTRHFHKIAMLKNNFPKSLIVSGWEGNLVEVLEDPQNPYYIGFQGHPELTASHPALNFLVMNAIKKSNNGALVSDFETKQWKSY